MKGDPVLPCSQAFIGLHGVSFKRVLRLVDA